MDDRRFEELADALAAGDTRTGVPGGRIDRGGAARPSSNGIPSQRLRGIAGGASTNCVDAERVRPERRTRERLLPISPAPHVGRDRSK